jgi:uncharacterized protein YjbJ (UPF0337 family)
MDTDQMSGNWTKLVGRAKRAWGELTDDDILKAEGSLDKLTGIIQAKWGDTKEAVKKKLHHVHDESRKV